jgi:hypothetical protein
MSARSRHATGSRHEMAGLLLLLALAALACGPPAGNPTPAPMVETVEVGVGFGEPVFLLDGSEEPVAASSAWIGLSPDGTGDAFAGELGVVDQDGAPALVQLRLELSPVAP